MNNTKQHTTEDRTINILFCGIGGQGILKAAEVCGWAAITDGFHVRKSEVHGMARRGGSGESDRRFGSRVFSRRVHEGGVDFLVPFYGDEEKRLKHFLRPGGIDLIDSLEKAETAVDSPRYVNTFMLGVLSTHLPVREESWHDALGRVFPAQTIDKNIEVFTNGRESAA
jgi:indolepyruvate ferredoxin oxidoreductase beta subunit